MRYRFVKRPVALGMLAQFRRLVWGSCFNGRREPRPGAGGYPYAMRAQSGMWKAFP